MCVTEGKREIERERGMCKVQRRETERQRRLRFGKSPVTSAVALLLAATVSRTCGDRIRLRSRAAGRTGTVRHDTITECGSDVSVLDDGTGTNRRVESSRGCADRRSVDT